MGPRTGVTEAGTEQGRGEIVSSEGGSGTERMVALECDRSSHPLLRILPASHPFTTGSRALPTGSPFSPISHPAAAGSLFQPHGLCAAAALTHCILYHLTASALTVPSAGEGLSPNTCLTFSLASFRRRSWITFHRSLPWAPHPKLHPSSVTVYLLSLLYFSL